MHAIRRIIVAGFAGSLLLASALPIGVTRVHAKSQPRPSPATSPATQPAQLGLPKSNEQFEALQREILGSWQGGPCVGDYQFKSDGTFELTHFTPGNNRLTGTWTLKWDAIPPTLVLTYQTSDFRVRDTKRPEFHNLGKTVGVKTLKLNRDELGMQIPGDQVPTEYEKSKRE